MGLVYATVELINADDLALQRRGFLQEDHVRHMAVNFLVDTGAYMLTINESIRAQLDLPTLETRPAELANGEVIQCDVVGPIELRYANRRSTQCAMVLPGETEPLLGALPLEDMDLVVEARTQRLIVNPEHPLAPQMSLK
ncbi:MAG: clan AA aspartic protease [Saprospiraceae bacterium]|nr:MAG: clan AA aspartic protease [Saprospiraceae bacterium]